jgi:ADP-ribose pyrophosphatase YjhB (NUDIX family)
MNQFNIRVYGLLINKNNEVLVSDERRSGYSFTKFPGGGLEFGEGIKDALIREFHEEMNLHVKIQELFYFNEHFQISAFHNKHQLISFYYFVKVDDLSLIGNEKYLVPLEEDGEKQRWASIDNELFSSLTFPIDKLVAKKMIEDFQK